MTPRPDASDDARPALLTFGHGRASREDLARLLHDAGVRRVVDVRRYPGSRAHPQVNRDALAQWLPMTGIEYRWEERLGGRRRLMADSPDTWWRVPAFRAYAGYMRTPAFRDAADVLLSDLGTAVTAVMCGESVWWRCHRRLIADFVVLARGGRVNHLHHDGRLTAHVAATGARLSAEGDLVYDGVTDGG